MTAHDWAQVARVFDEAVELETAAREAYLDTACGGDAGLRAEVDALLAAHDGAGDFLEQPALTAAGERLAGEAAAPLPSTIGPYLIRQQIGSGGMGVVYLADDTRLSRRVALKAIPGAGSDDPDRRSRFRQEARAAATLAHPGLATVYALEEIDGRLYLASEYVPGPTLRTVLRGGPLPITEVVAIARQLAQALAAAHAQGVVHGDLKPENVILTAPGAVKILDFGLARIDGQPRATDGTDSLAGTPGYMAPEQVRGEPIDFRADLFAFGVLVYELAAGRNPFAGDGAAAAARRTLEADPEPLEAVVPAAPPSLVEVVRRCLAKDPSARPASTGALRGELKRVQASLGTGRPVLPDGAPWPPRRWWAVHQVLVSATYVLALLPLWLERANVGTAGMPAALAGLALAVAATSIRMHLWFSTRVYPDETRAQRRRAGTWLRACDLAFGALLLAVALGIAAARPYPATLLVALAAGLVVANLLIEPSTERAAFGEPD